MCASLLGGNRRAEPDDLHGLPTRPAAAGGAERILHHSRAHVEAHGAPAGGLVRRPSAVARRHERDPSARRDGAGADVRARAGLAVSPRPARAPRSSRRDALGDPGRNSACSDFGPNARASRTPSEGRTGTGGRMRFGSNGGSAKRMPRNEAIPSFERPRHVPRLVSTMTSMLPPRTSMEPPPLRGQGTRVTLVTLRA
jgi:hypothetical protein